MGISNILVRCRAHYRPTTRSGTRAPVPLGSELKGFAVFFSPLQVVKYGQRDRSSGFPFPGSLRPWQNSSSWEEGWLKPEYSGIFKNGSFPPSALDRSLRGLFSGIYSETPVELLEANSPKCEGPLRLGPPGFSTALGLQQSANDSSGFPAQLITALVGSNSLYVSRALWPHFSAGSKKEGWFSSLFSF